MQSSVVPLIDHGEFKVWNTVFFIADRQLRATGAGLDRSNPAAHVY
jgi:hypothetical protein